MRRSRAKKATGSDPPKKAKATLAVKRCSVGMPALDSITGIDEIVKGKKVLHIIHTDEVDAYERAPSKVKAKCRIPDDHEVVDGTVPSLRGASLSWFAGVFCFSVLTAVVDGCTAPRSAASSSLPAGRRRPWGATSSRRGFSIPRC